jgi:hypothetical protein
MKYRAMPSIVGLMLAVASSAAAQAIYPSGPPSPAGPAITPYGPNAGYGTGLLLMQQYVAYDAMMRMPAQTPAQAASAQAAWLTNGAETTSVPSSGPGSAWYTNGAEAIPAPGPLGYLAPSPAASPPPPPAASASAPPPAPAPSASAPPPVTAPAPTGSAVKSRADAAPPPFAIPIAPPLEVGAFSAAPVEAEAEPEEEEAAGDASAATANGPTVHVTSATVPRTSTPPSMPFPWRGIVGGFAIVSALAYFGGARLARLLLRKP